MRRLSMTVALLAFALAPATLFAQTTIVVPGTAGPWEASLNPTFDYTWARDYTAPIVISAATGISFAPGSIMTVTYVTGLVSGGNGFPLRDANGDPNQVTNNCGPGGSNGACPAFYMNPSVPVYIYALVGTFANNGVIVGQPFLVGNGPTSLTVPAGANQLLLGINDNFYGDNTGSFTVSVSQPYAVCRLYDQTKAAQSGSTIPIKLQLCDAAGGNLSSSTIALHATGVTQVSTSISGAVQSAGNANPDNDFRFDAALGSTGGYIFNLKTTGLSTGTYNLNFTVGDGSFSYAAPFQVK